MLLGAGDGSLSEIARSPVASAPRTMASGDFNGDGHLDLVVGYASGL